LDTLNRESAKAAAEAAGARGIGCVDILVGGYGTETKISKIKKKTGCEVWNEDMFRQAVPKKAPASTGTERSLANALEDEGQAKLQYAIRPTAPKNAPVTRPDVTLTLDECVRPQSKDYHWFTEVNCKKGEAFDANVHVIGLETMIKELLNAIPSRPGGSSCNVNNRVGNVHLAPGSSDIFRDGIVRQIVGFISVAVVRVCYGEGATKEMSAKGESSFVEALEAFATNETVKWNINKAGANATLTDDNSIYYYVITALAVILPKPSFNPWQKEDRRRSNGESSDTDIIIVCMGCGGTRYAYKAWVDFSGEVPKLKADEFRADCTKRINIDGRSANCGKMYFKLFDENEYKNLVPKKGLGTHRFMKTAKKKICMWPGCKKDTYTWCTDPTYLETAVVYREGWQPRKGLWWYCWEHRLSHYKEMEAKAGAPLCFPSDLN
jgi:hypothetical protein